MKTAALIVAAGRGERAGGDVPKQYQVLSGQPIIARTIARFSGRGDVVQIVLVVHPDDRERLHRSVTLPAHAVVVDGGATRGASVRAGLAAVADGIGAVLIHDAARPLVMDAVIDRVIGALASHEGAAPALPVSDALWRVGNDHVAAMQPRGGLYRAQTPQGFHLDTIRAAYEAQADSASAADDVEIARACGVDVKVVEGDEDNLKLTYPGDFARAERILGTGMDIRTGNGFDVHRFGPGDHVTLCGVDIPHGRGLQGHSDADVGMHALTDAIYGALAEGDIGQHFPPSDPQWKGAESHIFLRHACELAAKRGYRITHADCTLICEQPKIGPHAEAMRAALAGIMGLDADRISVKATTSERLGFTGREEGIAAIATATLVSA